MTGPKLNRYNVYYTLEKFQQILFHLIEETLRPNIDTAIQVDFRGQNLRVACISVSRKKLDRNLVGWQNLMAQQDLMWLTAPRAEFSEFQI